VLERKIVLPGDVIAATEEYEAGEGTYESEGQIYAAMPGILDLDGEVVNAGSHARSERLGRSFGVVLDQRQIDGAVAQVARGVVPHFAGLDLFEAENVFVELRGFL